MLKKLKFLYLCVLLCAFSSLFYGCNLSNTQNKNPGSSSVPYTPVLPKDHLPQEKQFIKAAWIPTAYRLNYPSKYTTDSHVLKKDLDAIVMHAKTLGFNTLFFQVRPAADAFYASQIFPWSRYISGVQGIAPKDDFDPLAYLTHACHINSISLHAWINPFRITAYAGDVLIDNHPAFLCPELTFCVNEKLYFDPGHPTARQLIIDGVREIVQNYAVDGIHFDDYFYPEGIVPDADTFALYGKEFNEIDDFRRASVTALIADTYASIKKINTSVCFGVSPSGIWANQWHHPLGSLTNGFESYYQIFADSRSWIKDGLIDYIVPQIYWHIGQTGSDFIVLINWWKEVCLHTDVALLIGLAGYKVDDINAGSAWVNSEEIEKQLHECLAYADGFSIYTFMDSQKSGVTLALSTL